MILHGACEMTHIFVCIRKNKTNNYAENLTCHSTKFSHSRCILADLLSPFLLSPVELISLAFPRKSLFSTSGQARDCHKVIGWASLSNELQLMKVQGVGLYLVQPTIFSLSSSGALGLTPTPKKTYKLYPEPDSCVLHLHNLLLQNWLEYSFMYLYM
jgi:hypothetical protein